VPVAEQIGTTANGLSDFSVSSYGALVYRGGATNDNRLVWVDRNGKELSEVDKPAPNQTTSLSPDGMRLAIAKRDSQGDKVAVWIRDLARGVTSRFTFNASNESSPVWSADGSRVVFSSDRKGSPSLYEKGATGTGSEKELWSCGETLIANDWSRDGKFLAVNRLTSKNTWDIWIVPADGSKPFPFVESPFIDALPVFSPDGRYVAYMSNESGRVEVYVQQFPGPGGKWQISANGGIEPHWSADGKTIYFLGLDSKMMATAVAAGATFTAEAPQPLFDAHVLPGQRRNSFLVSRDGQRFLLLAPVGRDRIAPITVVLNWPASLHD
jgi:Tol biopolymer transport system component